jgi:ATP-dependent DNA helicase RecG
MQKILLSAELHEIHGIGPRFVMKLKKLGIITVKDLIWHFPRRYEDWRETSSIDDLEIGDSKTIKGVISEIESRRSWKRRMTIVEATITDETGSIKAVWFNQPYVKNILHEGVIASFAGKVIEDKKGKNSLHLSNPTYEILNGESFDDEIETKHTGRLVPIYPETKGLTSKGIRMLSQKILDNLEPIKEFLPQEILRSHNFPQINVALRNIHFPDNLNDAEIAKERFAFEELFLIQLNNLYQKFSLSKENAPVMDNAEIISDISKNLPFELTRSQKEALSEILIDLKKSEPMNRLLQGDVGSGKTIVAGLTAIVAAHNGYQSAIMAPTEILARQHYKTLAYLFPNFIEGIGLLVSKEARVSYGENLETDIKKPAILKKVSEGKIKILVGTHALIEKGVIFKNLGLVVVDEQHRFGVKQRAALSGHTGLVPHFLSMSATPIPRTIMMTMFGDLNLSIISELPKGRKEIITKIIDPDNRNKAYAFIRGQVRRGRQVFVVCPRIEPSEANPISSKWNSDLEQLEIKSVKEEYEKLEKIIFPDLKVAMLHGKMKSDEKAKTMSDFAGGKIDVLVSTSVIEVGVDVPNASIMMIEGSERFGLAQLYQFRGRVGRGQHQSFCFLFTESSSINTRDRLNSLITAKNGLELAEKDLRFRGPGEFMGKEQTGMPDIAMRALQKPELVKSSKDEAELIAKQGWEMKNYPDLYEKFREFRKKVHLE